MTSNFTASLLSRSKFILTLWKPLVIFLHAFLLGWDREWKVRCREIHHNETIPCQYGKISIPKSSLSYVPYTEKTHCTPFLKSPSREAGRRVQEDDILGTAVSSSWLMEVLHWGHDFNSFLKTWIKWRHRQIHFPVKHFTSWRQLRADVTYCAGFIFAFGPANCCTVFQALKLGLCLLKEALQTHWLWVQQDF